MAVDVQIDGAKGIALVAAAVRRLGADRTIVNEMAREIRRAVPPIRAAVKANAAAYLPHRGGLSAWAARARVTAQVRRGAATAGVSITAGRNSTGKRSDIKSMDAGRVRHPTYGHKPWRPQAVRAGFVTDAVTDDGAKAFREAVVVAVDRAARRVLG